MRLLGPYIVRSVAKKAGEPIKETNRPQQQYGHQQPQSTVKEGETSIDKMHQIQKPARSRCLVGEYVDYEEVE